MEGGSEGMGEVRGFGLGVELGKALVDKGARDVELGERWWRMRQEGVKGSEESDAENV